MALHLLAHPKVQNGVRYCYYTLSQSFREEGRVRKKTVATLGKLTDEQAETLRTALRIKNDASYQLLRPSDITSTNQVRFLDVAVFHQLWRSLQIETVIDAGSRDIALSTLLEILVVNRCVEPRSKSGVSRWVATTALDQILEIPLSSMNESRLYRALPSIEAHHEKIEQHLYKHISPHASSLYFYDLSSSYFEGECVSMGAFNEHSKDHRPDRLQVVLGLLMNEQGLPFSWELFRGNQGDAPTLKLQLKKFKERFHIENAICVFDRGFLSADNLRRVEEAGYQYVTGLDAPQIETLLSFTKQDWLATINADTCEEIVSKQKKWQRFDDTQFYCPIGVVNDRQTILLFDVARYRKSILERQEKIETFKTWVSQHNEWLAEFKKNAEKSAIAKDVEAELKKRNLSSYVTYQLHEIVTDNSTFVRRKNNPYPSQGYLKKIRSFQIVVKEHNHRLLDGVFALITSPDSPLDPPAIIHAYRQKYLIEAAFREMKSVLKLRPWFVYKEEHVKAHYTLCVLAYFLERLLDLKLEEHHLKDEGWTLPQLKEELEKIHRIDLSLAGKTHTVLQSIPEKLRSLLTQMDLKKTLSLPL